MPARDDNPPLLGPDRDDDRPAVTVGDRALRRSELWEAAGVVAQRIAGAPAVAVHGDASLETVVSVVGGLLAGVPVVPVPSDSGTSERAHVLADSGAALWLGPPTEGVSLERVEVDPTARGSASAEPDPDATALIMYTSGTTGKPKGVVMSRRAIAADLDALADAWSWTAGDTLVHGLPLFHVHGLVLGTLGALRHGSPLVHTVRPRPEAYAAAGGTLYFGVPTVWSRVADSDSAARGLSGARLLVSGSAGLPDRVAEKLRALSGLSPVERYGMTETLITVAARADAPVHTGWVGTPVAGVESRLRTEHGDPVPHDGVTVGDLQVRGATMFDGYLGLAEATAASWTDDGWFRTGDAAVITGDGRHRIVGRISVDLIKTGGYRVGAGEIEAALLEHPTVRECAVVGEPDDDLGQRIVAYVVGDDVRPADLIAHVAGGLSAHKRPREVRVLESLPRNAMGKVQKTRLGNAPT
ncbi:acyl-CoA synthetase [Pseudonocardia sp. N23]|uniref:acyl-CoA synthetase n=1 Tax=Pseudonocardia sp. N23 TaxID=1987376 RepID=UPI00209C6B98|nr:acyl-CoA synthetase [Pseudonocardia sp. N23]